jgi:hypothetical protein
MQVSADRQEVSKSHFLFEVIRVDELKRVHPQLHRCLNVRSP